MTALADRATVEPPEVDDQVTAYARSVVEGEVVAGRLVILACERHLRDLGDGHERGLWFDRHAAGQAVAFFALLRQSKGQWGGQRIELQPWQAFRIGSVFGWKREDGTRRFRYAYNEVARKNGKTTEAAGIGLLAAFFDGELGAEVYAVATKREQARRTWDEARYMVGKEPRFKQFITVQAANMHNLGTASKFEPLGSDKDTSDGLNMHMGLFDELHAWKDRLFWTKLTTATGSRAQPLIWIITTAGEDEESVCGEQADYGIKVLERVYDDDDWFVYIARIDDESEWDDEAAWPKANPNLGVTKFLDTMRADCRKAQNVPAEKPGYLRMHCGLWVKGVSRWLRLDTWDDQGKQAKLQSLEGRPCFGGLDLSSTIDLTAFALWFPDEDGDGGDLFLWHWVPAETLLRRSREDRVPYNVWAERRYAGEKAERPFVEPTDGPVIDYDVIRKRVGELGERFQIESIGYDPYNATQLVGQLENDGFTMVKVPQNMLRLSPPTKELQRLVLSKGLRHGANPVLRWQASNVVVKSDSEENLKPNKEKSGDRIDGIVAGVMAISEAMAGSEGEAEPQFYG